MKPLEQVIAESAAYQAGIATVRDRRIPRARPLPLEVTEEGLTELEMEIALDRRFQILRIDALRELAAQGHHESAIALRWELNERRLDMVDDLRLDPGEVPVERESYRPLGSKLRALIFQRDGRKCGLCGAADGPFQIDHKIPYSRGGRHQPDNLWVTCIDCNQAKGALTVEEYLDMIEESH